MRKTEDISSSRRSPFGESSSPNAAAVAVHRRRPAYMVQRALPEQLPWGAAHRYGAGTDRRPFGGRYWVVTGLGAVANRAASQLGWADLRACAQSAIGILPAARRRGLAADGGLTRSVAATRSPGPRASVIGRASCPIRTPERRPVFLSGRASPVRRESPTQGCDDQPPGTPCLGAVTVSSMHSETLAEQVPVPRLTLWT